MQLELGVSCHEGQAPQHRAQRAQKEAQAGIVLFALHRDVQVMDALREAPAASAGSKGRGCLGHRGSWDSCDDCSQPWARGSPAAAMPHSSARIPSFQDSCGLPDRS